MSSWFARPTVFSAYAAVSEGDDPDLARGAHLRLFPSSAIGFPLAPIGVWKVEALSLEPLDFLWFDRGGRALATPDLDRAGGEVFGWMKTVLADDPRLLGVELRFPAGGEGRIALLDRSHARVITQRSRGRLLVGAPAITGIRLRGRGVPSVLGWVVTHGRAFESVVGSPPIERLSAPIEGDAPWYVSGEGRDRALRRVRDGAPLRLTPPDRPDGPFDPLTPVDEEARLAAFSNEIDAEFALLVGDPATTPVQVKDSHIVLPEVISPGRRRPWQRVDLDIQSSLLMKALDPGVARYLGLMTRLDSAADPIDAAGRPGATAWLAGGVFACGALDRLQVPPPDAMETRILERLSETTPQLRRARRIAEQRGLVPRAFVTAALGAPMPDLPEPPDVRLANATWLRADEGPSTAFRQPFLVGAPPLATLVALGRLEAEGWRTRHALVGPTERAAPRVLGQQDSLAAGRLGLVDDSGIEADAAPWTYRLALSDVFGRFGAGSDVSVPIPERPEIPLPTLTAQLALAPRAAHDGPAAAGTVTLQVAVPAMAEMTAGSLALARVIVGLDGAPPQGAASPQAGGSLAFEFALPELLPLEARTPQATARFEDIEGHLGPEAAIRIDIADPRAPAVPKCGIAIVWSSRPGPSEDVEFRLRFAGLPGARYRAYLSDARGLGIATSAGDRPRTRAEIAVDGAQQGLAGLNQREHFRLLTDAPLVPGVDGRVLFETHLPRALETVQFLRFVPLSDRGSEADFARCPLLPIAVPSDRAPLAPRVEAQVDPDSGVAHLKIVALGLDLVALAAAEPGLFEDPPAAAAHTPIYRLRRASGAVPDAIYAREIGRGALAFDGEVFKAELDDEPTAAGLTPYVRWFYWAEVRMPPERRLPAGVAEVPLPAGAIEPTQAAQREDAPGSFSLPSAPVMAMRVPPEVPALPPDACSASVTPGAGGATWVLSLAIAGGPVAHARAVGNFRVALHLQLDGGDLVAEPGEQPLAGGALDWSVERAGALPTVRLGIVLIDPIDRRSAPLFVDAAQI